MPTVRVLGPVGFLVLQRVVVVVAADLARQWPELALVVTRLAKLRPSRKVELMVLSLEGQEPLLVGWKMFHGHEPLFLPWPILERVSNLTVSGTYAGPPTWRANLLRISSSSDGPRWLWWLR